MAPILLPISGAVHFARMPQDTPIVRPNTLPKSLVESGLARVRSNTACGSHTRDCPNGNCCYGLATRSVQGQSATWQHRLALQSSRNFGHWPGPPACPKSAIALNRYGGSESADREVISYSITSVAHEQRGGDGEGERF